MDGIMKYRIKDMINNEIISLADFNYNMEVERDGDEYWLYLIGAFPNNRLYLYTYYSIDDLLKGIEFWAKAGKDKIDEKIEFNNYCDLF